MGITRNQLIQMPECEFQEKLRFLADSGVLPREKAQKWLKVDSAKIPPKSAAPGPEPKPMKKGLLDEEESEDEWVPRDDEDEPEDEPRAVTTVSTEAAPKALKIVTVKSSKKIYWDMAQETATIMNVSPGLAAVLLMKYKWKKERLLDDFVTNPEKPFKYCRLPPFLSKETLVLEKFPAGTCEICFCEAEELYGLGCRHTFCMECWRAYVTGRVKAQTQVISCMMDQCPYPLSPLEVERIEPAIGQAYGKVLSDADVEMGGVKLQCIRPNCEFILTLESLGLCNVATCKCGMRMCWLCHEEAHAPLHCSDVLRWKKVAKIELLEALNDAWEKSNTKPCPACNKAIEKNGMGFKGLWWLYVHKRGVGGDDQYVEKAPDEQESKQAAAIIYRFDANVKSQAKEKEMREKMYKRVCNRLTGAGVARNEAMTQTDHILDVIATARSVLTWSYPYSYFYAQNGPEARIFARLLSNLDKYLEDLTFEVENKKHGVIPVTMVLTVEKHTESLLRHCY